MGLNWNVHGSAGRQSPSLDPSEMEGAWVPKNNNSGDDRTSTLPSATSSLGFQPSRRLPFNSSSFDEFIQLKPTSYGNGFVPIYDYQMANYKTSRENRLKFLRHESLAHQTDEIYMKLFHLGNSSTNSNSSAEIRMVESADSANDSAAKSSPNSGSEVGDAKGPYYKSTILMQSMDYYPVANDSVQCDTIPENVMNGQPLLDSCLEGSEMSRMCHCMKKPQVMVDFLRQNFPDMLAKYDESTGYMNVCGTCRDPCSLKFIPDGMDEMAQKMAQRLMEQLGGFFGNRQGNPMKLIFRIMQMLMSPNDVFVKMEAKRRRVLDLLSVGMTVKEVMYIVSCSWSLVDKVKKLRKDGKSLTRSGGEGGPQ
eukprot:maker-scaffold20_size707684-snap-gene-2.10 protein:Tk03841 transcript:maker-scaffold20_size707684-snap-gene-2.10-mRNA-1 annotation:"hypothetical protein"